MVVACSWSRYERSELARQISGFGLINMVDCAKVLNQPIWNEYGINIKPIVGLMLLCKNLDYVMDILITICLYDLEIALEIVV